MKLECLEHIATGENTFAIDKMKMYFQKHHDSDLNVLIVLQSQLSKLKMDTELQVVESEEAQIAYNKSILGLVNLADSLSN